MGLTKQQERFQELAETLIERSKRSTGRRGTMLAAADLATQVIQAAGHNQAPDRYLDEIHEQLSAWDHNPSDAHIQTAGAYLALIRNHVD